MFNKALKYLFLMILSSLFVANAYSAEEIVFENITTNSIDLLWEDVDWIELYQILYGKESWTWKTLKTEYLEDLNYSFSDLEEKTTYYFTLVWFDESGEKVYESYEASVNTLELEVNDLYLEDSYMIWKNEMLNRDCPVV